MCTGLHNISIWLEIYVQAQSIVMVFGEVNLLQNRLEVGDEQVYIHLHYPSHSFV